MKIYRIPGTVMIEGMGDTNSWLRMVGHCRYQDDGITNIFILGDKNLEIEDIRRF